MSLFGSGLLRASLRALTGRSRLPVFELQQANVESKKKGRIRPFDPARGFTRDPLCPPAGPPSPVLSLTGLRLAHAVIKADRLRPMPYAYVAALGFLLEHLSTFDWRRDNLRLFNDVSSAYADFSGTSLAGRVGQGIALLIMEQRGFAFSAHYPRVAGKSGPDFIMQSLSAGNGRVLVESKGSFVPPNTEPRIKGVLRDGLDQISGAPTHGATKSFVIGSFLREAGDQSVEPSLVALVDPESDGDAQSEERSPDWIVRQNYAGWLDAMGLPEWASDLRGQDADASRVELRLRVLRVDGVEYAIAPSDPWTDDGIGLDWWQMMRDRQSRSVAFGLRVSVLRAIKQSIRRTGAGLDAQVREALGGTTRETLQGESPYESTMSDGSLLALVPIGDLMRGGEEMTL